MAPSLRRAVAGLPVRVVSGGGASSVTLIHAEAAGIVTACRDSVPTVLLYVGDLDKHGIFIENRVADDLDAFVRDLGNLDDRDLSEALRFRPIAVTVEQVPAFNLPQDPNSPGSYQAEAIPPDALVGIVRQEVESELDMDVIARVKAEEERERLDIRRHLEGL